MRKEYAFYAAALIYLFAIPCDIAAQIRGFNHIKWTKNKLCPGLVWKSTHSEFDTLGLQNINILIVNLLKRDISIHYDMEKNVAVNTQASSTEAVAAVNAGFFNIKEGGSVTYIRTAGKIQESDTAKKWNRNSNMNGSVLIDSMGRLLIEPGHSNQWYDDHAVYPEILLTGPLLLQDKKKFILPGTSLVTLRHPRTAIGTKGRNRVLLITVDGRTESAKGMTLAELTDLMISLKCTGAVNLDGGGSTTMWIRNEPNNGIVNMPCDNKKFDHEGARAVSDILIVQ